MPEKATTEEINQLVDLHLANLKDGIFPILGKDILRNFYSYLFSDKSCFNFISKDGNDISGFAIATSDMRGLMKGFRKKHLVKILIKSITVLLKSPKFLSLFLQSVNYKIVSNNELIFIYVDENKKRKGLGTDLFKKIDKEFLKRGKYKYQVTVSADNIVANNFYKKNKFKLVRQLHSKTLVRNIYIKEIEEN